MFAGQYEPGWIPTADKRGYKIAYTYWDGSRIRSYVAGENCKFNTWIFGVPKTTEPYLNCWQYPDRTIHAYSIFDNWYSARDWAITIAKLNSLEDTNAL